LEHEHDLLRSCVPVLGVGLSRKDVHEPKALLAAGGEIVVGDPLDPTPLVDDGLNVSGLRDYALQHCLPPCGLESELAVVWRPPSGRGDNARCPPRHECSAFDYRLQFHRHLNNGEKNVSLQAPSSSEIVHIGLACPSFGGEYRFLSDIVSSCLTLDYIYKCPRKFTWPWMTLQFDEKPFDHVAQKLVRNPCYFEYREALH